MLLLQKIEKLEQISRDLNALLNENQRLISSEISQQILQKTASLSDEIKSVVNDEIAKILPKINDEVKHQTSSEILAQIFKENIENNAPFLNKLLKVANFDKELKTAICESLQNQICTFYRYQNATNILAICLQNQLSAIDEALKLVMSIELNAKKLELDEPYYKVFFEI